MTAGCVTAGVLESCQVVIYTFIYSNITQPFLRDTFYCLKNHGIVVASSVSLPSGEKPVSNVYDTSSTVF